jgi:hypothetical protein
VAVQAAACVAVAARAPSREALTVLPTACDTVAVSAPSREVKLEERDVLPAA